jgi:hypothetical protein
MAFENAVIVTSAEPAMPTIVTGSTTDTDQGPAPETGQDAGASTTTPRDSTGRFVSPQTEVEGVQDPTSSAEATSPGAEEIPAKKGSPQHRINQAIARQREAERQLEAERQQRQQISAEMSALRAQLPQPVQPPPPPVAFPHVDGEPTEDQFEDFGDYIKALSVFHARMSVRMEAAARQQAAEQDQQEQQIKTALTEHQKRVALGKQAHADYGEVVIENGEVELSPPMQDAIIYSPIGHEVAYYLGKHPDEAERILRLPPGPALIEMGKLEGKLSGVATPPASGHTQAPPPIRPVSGGTHSASRDLASLPIAEYIKVRQQQIQARRT